MGTWQILVAAFAIIGTIHIILSVLRRRRWAKDKELLCLDIGQRVGGSLSPHRSLHLLRHDHKVVIPQNGPPARLILADAATSNDTSAETRLVVRLTFPMSSPVGFRVLLRLRHERRPGSWVDLLGLPLFEGMGRVETGNPTFDEWFSAYSAWALGFRTVITPDVQQALLQTADSIRALGEGARRRGLSINLDGTQLEFTLCLPPEWLPPAELVVEFYERARETHRAIDEVCRQQSGMPR